MATAPTTPPADGAALPAPPSTSDPVNFDVRGDSFFAALPALQTEENALKANVYTNSMTAYSNALEAAGSAVAAAGSESNTAALANFKGNWSALTGAIAKPASVFHNGAFWALLNNLADVTASQPGVSADWQVCGGAFPIVPISTNITAVPWKTYAFYGACTLTAPAISGNGKQLGIIVLPGVTGAIFAPAGSDKTRGASGSQTIDAPFTATLTDSGATYGWM